MFYAIHPIRQGALPALFGERKSIAGQCLARCGIIRMINRAQAQALGDLGEQLAIFNVMNALRLCLSDVKRNAEDVNIRLPKMHEAHRRYQQTM
jgi:hypothetical protein